jgi:hypothetical protein
MLLTPSNDGIKEYEKVREDFERIGNKLFILEQKVIVTKRNQVGARSLFSSIQSGLSPRKCIYAITY